MTGAGVAIIAPSGHVLFLRRSGASDHVGEWCLPGGGVDEGETSEAAARREAKEETGFESGAKFEFLHQDVSPEGIDFTTFRTTAPKFRPVLNDEHDRWTWARPDNFPKPLHPAVQDVLSRITDRAAMGNDGMILAFDRDSARSYDKDNRLHVASTNISKGGVNPYLGAEIPNGKELGLDAAKVYRLFRDPDELKKAAPTFNNLPLLSRHVHVSALAHHPELVIGSTGTDAEFEGLYLKNSLVVWTKDAIDGIENGDQKELSSSYHYRAEMTPGRFNGEEYDGVMRDIVGNHVALVKKGRAGSDVAVGDSMENLLMAKKANLSTIAALTLGALAVHLAPKIAKDEKLDLTPALAGVTAKNFGEKKDAIFKSVRDLTAGKLANDASIDDVVALLNKVEGAVPAEDDENANSALPIVMPDDDTSMDDDPIAKIKAMLKAAGVADDIIAKIDEAVGAATDEKTDPPVKPAAAKDKDPDADEGADKPVTQTAMDEAIKAAVTSTEKRMADKAKAYRDAENAVRPYVGTLAVAFDSADAVYAHALKTLGLKVDGVHPSAFPALLATQPVPGSKSPKKATVAMDAAAAADFATRYPNAARIQVF